MSIGVEVPIARCPVNGVEAFGYPFFIRRGDGIEPDQILLEVHTWHLTEEERREMGELVRIQTEDDLVRLGFPRDDNGAFVIGFPMEG